MKTLKKNNKGFSLVELIVVILIMAIIAVALAPQVMKWVDESKVSTDVNNRANLKSSLDAAVADYLSKGNDIENEVKFQINKNGAPANITNKLAAAGTGFASSVDEVTNGFWPEFKSTDDGCFDVTISKTGAVTVLVLSGKDGKDYGDGQGEQ